MSDLKRVQINRRRPAYLLFVIDQSGSMQFALAGAGGESKAELVAKTVNRVLYNLIKVCTRSRGDDVEVRHYFDVTVLGYGSPLVRNALSGALADKLVVPLPELADAALGQAKVRVPQKGRDGSVSEVEEVIPIWVEPVKLGGTPMKEALEQARELAAAWVDQHPQSFPPIVLHITDGEATTGDPSAAAAALRALSTEHGHVLLLNCHITTDAAEPVLYPVDAAEVPDGAAGAAELFAISSELRPEMVALAREAGHLQVQPQSRGYVYNGGMVELVDFLNIGTIQTQTIRLDM